MWPAAESRPVATIHDNLALADAEADEAAMDAACRIAQLDGFIASLPDGHDTAVGEEGLLLSGGERRRLAPDRSWPATRSG